MRCNHVCKSDTKLNETNTKKVFGLPCTHPNVLLTAQVWLHTNSDFLWVLTRTAQVWLHRNSAQANWRLRVIPRRLGALSFSRPSHFHKKKACTVSKLMFRLLLNLVSGILLSTEMWSIVWQMAATSKTKFWILHVTNVMISKFSNDDVLIAEYVELKSYETENWTQT